MYQLTDGGLKCSVTMNLPFFRDFENYLVWMMIVRVLQIMMKLTIYLWFSYIFHIVLCVNLIQMSSFEKPMTSTSWNDGVNVIIDRMFK